MPGLPDGGRYRASCGNYKINGRTFIAVLGGVRNMITTKGNYGLLEVNSYFMVLKIWIAAFLGAKHLVPFFSCSLKMREKYISFAQFVYFMREVCLLINF